MIISSYLEIKNSLGQITAYISPSDGLKECYIDTHLSGESTLEFYLPTTCEKLDKITPECKIFVGNKEFTILKDDATDVVRDDRNTLWAKIMAVESWHILDTKFPEPYINNDPTITNPASLTVTIVGGGNNLSGGLYTVGSAAHALYALLQGTGWTLGTVDVSGTHDLETEKTSILENIKQVQETWGGNLVWDSINKTVSLRDETLWQNYTGFQIRYAKNLKNITRTQSNKLITRLYPFGKDALDIASVNGGIKYIENTSYTSYRYVGTYENQDIIDAQILKDEAIKILDKNCKPRYLYRIKVVDLRTLPEYSHEEFALGDMADIIDDGINANTRIRIIRHRYEVFNPWNCELEIGDPKDRFIDKLKGSFDTSNTINGASNSKNQISGSYIQSLSADKITAGTIDASEISVINLNASNITSGTINASAISVTNISATNITSGSLSGNRIYGGTITGTILQNTGSLCRVQVDSSGFHVINQLGGGTENIEKITLTTYDFDGNGVIKFFNNSDNDADIRFNDSNLTIRSDLNVNITAPNLYISNNAYMGGSLIATQNWVGIQGYTTQSWVNMQRTTSYDHSHGIPNGTVLATAAGGSVTFYTDSHDHWTTNV